MGNVEFFPKLEEAIPNVSNKNNREFLKLEFSLHLHFTVFALRNGQDQVSQFIFSRHFACLLNESLKCYIFFYIQSSEQFEENTQRFKYYLENRGAILSQESEYLPYFALPYIPNPSQHSAFAELFQVNTIQIIEEVPVADWARRRRSTLRAVG